MKTRPLVPAACVLLGSAALAGRLVSSDAVAVMVMVGVAGAVAPLDFGGRARTGRAAAVVLGLAAVLLASLPGSPHATVTRAAVFAGVLAAIAEEAFFRRLVYGWAARWGAGVAIAVSAALFAAVHLPVYGLAAMPVDLAAGMFFGWQRWSTGSWTVPAITHAAANLVA